MTDPLDLDVLMDLVGPPRGPCGLCGASDARHRIADAIAEHIRAGDNAHAVADDYGIPVADAERLAAEWFGFPDD